MVLHTVLDDRLRIREVRFDRVDRLLQVLARIANGGQVDDDVGTFDQLFDLGTGCETFNWWNSRWSLLRRCWIFTGSFAMSTPGTFQVGLSEMIASSKWELMKPATPMMQIVLFEQR